MIGFGFVKKVTKEILGIFVTFPILEISNKQIMEKIISQPDKILIQQILKGEKGLFAQIIRRYNQRLFRAGMAILNNDAETEDAMQSTYINAYEHLAQFENRAAFATWLTRIMVNECLKLKKKRTQTVQLSENHITMTTPAHVLVNKELNNLLENAVSQLPEKYRLVFMLREMEEMSVKETAEVLTIEETNVKVRLNRAKTMLRESLKDYMKGNIYHFHLSRCDRMVNHVMTALNLF